MPGDDATNDAGGRRRRVLKSLAIAAAVGLVSALLVGVAIQTGAVPAGIPGLRLPRSLEAAERSLARVTRVVDVNGDTIGHFKPEQRRSPVQYDEIPESVIHAVVAAEDDDFFDHAGADLVAALRAALTNAQEGEIVQGGSTITQQLAKNLYTSGDQNMWRKLRELRYAIALESEHTKQEILAAYINTVYLGEGAVGFGAGARTYFRKPLQEVSLSEAAMLAGLIPAPALYNPRADPKRAETQRKRVLDRIEEEGLASERVIDAARAEKPQIHSVRERVERFPYFMDYVRRAALEQWDVGPDRLYQGGLTIETTLDPRIQREAKKAIESHLGAAPELSAAVVVTAPHSGAVRALVGGRDFATQKVNTALGEMGGGTGRQPGSSFKPFVLATAYEQGASPADPIDAPRTYRFEGAEEPVHNYERRGYGRVNLAVATHRSINTAFAGMVDELGPEEVAELARDAGLQLPKDDIEPSIAVGAYEVAPLRLTSAYGVFATGGVHVKPTPIRRVVTPDGSPRIAEPDTLKDRPRVVGEDTSKLVTSTLRGVVERGTGTAADIGRPVAGKTGTSDDYADAWFVGYSPQLVGGVWVGDPTGNVPMTDVAGIGSVTGGSIPARIWRDVMATAHAGLPVERFSSPPHREPSNMFVDDPPPQPPPSDDAPAPPASPPPTSEPPPDPEEPPQPPPPTPEPEPSPGPDPDPSPEPPPEPDPDPEDPLPEDPLPERPL